MGNRNDIRLLGIAFFVLAVAMRLVPHAYNVSAIAAMGLFLGCFASARWGFVAVLAAMFVSDLLGELLGIESMGFYAPWMMLVVYLAMACSAPIGRFLTGSRSSEGRLRVPLWAGVPVGAVVSTVVFFLITNFASWLDPQMLYSQTLAGLADCFWQGIPFARSTLVGNVAFSIAFFAAYAVLVERRAEKRGQASF